MKMVPDIVRRKFFQPVHDLLRNSSRLAYWRHIEKTQYWPEDKLRKVQWDRFLAMIRFAYENNEFYQQSFKRAGISPEDMKKPEDIRRLPVLTKGDIRANTPRLISQGFNIQNLQKAKTGGSTGKALDLYFTEECSELRNACALRHDRWTSWEPGEPIAACWGNPHLPRTFKERLKHFALQPMIYLDTMSVNEKSVSAFVSEWEKVKPTLLYGHAHSIYVLARYLYTQ